MDNQKLTADQQPANVSRRYSVQKTTNGTYAIYDAHRGVTILKSVSPQAKYNELVANHVVKLLNGGYGAGIYEGGE